MHMHLKLTTDEAVARLQGNWAADVAAYDQVHATSSTCPTCSRPGIVKQFPARFRWDDARQMQRSDRAAPSAAGGRAAARAGFPAAAAVSPTTRYDLHALIELSSAAAAELAVRILAPLTSAEA